MRALIKKHGFFFFLMLALITHFLLLLSFIIHFEFKNHTIREIPNIPAYVYREEKYNPEQRLPTPLHEVEKKLVSSNGIEKSNPPNTKTTSAQLETVSMGKGKENINLTLKSKNPMDKPLLNLITKATAAHLFYPKIAMDFRLRGRAIVGFIIYPDGHLTDVTLLESSGTTVLDEAALVAIRAISPVLNVNFYLTEAEPLMMGIIFD